MVCFVCDKCSDLTVLTFVFVFISVAQRKVCSPAGSLSCHVTAHFLKVRTTSVKFKEKSDVTVFHRVRILTEHIRWFLLSRVCYLPVYAADAPRRNSTTPGLRSVSIVLCSWSLQWYCLFSIQQLSNCCSLTFESYTFAFSHYAYCMWGATSTDAFGSVFNMDALYVLKPANQQVVTITVRTFNMLNVRLQRH